MRLPEMLAAGLNIGLGHDAAECNNSRDMFEVMKWPRCCTGRCGSTPACSRRPTWCGWRPATAPRVGHETGQLGAGQKADVILVETNSTMFTPLMPESAEHVFSHLVFAANGSCVDTTICDGKVLMEGRRILTIDEDEVIAKANAAFREVVGRMVVPDLETVQA